MYADKDLAKLPVEHSVEMSVSSVFHLEEVPEEDESFTSSVYSTHEQSDSDLDRTSSFTATWNLMAT